MMNSTVHRAMTSAAGKMYVRVIASILEWNQSMLFRRTKLSLRNNRSQGARKIFRGLGGFDDVIHQTTPSRYVGIGKSVAVTLNEFFAPERFIFRFIDFMTEDNLRRTFCAHYCNFSGRPCHNAIRSQFFAAHGDVGPAISFAQHDGYFWNGRSRIREEHLCSVTNNAAVFLLNAG